MHVKTKDLYFCKLQRLTAISYDATDNITYKFASPIQFIIGRKQYKWAGIQEGAQYKDVFTDSIYDSYTHAEIGDICVTNVLALELRKKYITKRTLCNCYVALRESDILK